MKFLSKTFVKLLRREKYASDQENCQRVRVLLARKVNKKEDFRNYSGYRGVILDLDYNSKTDRLDIEITNGGSTGSHGHTGSLVVHAQLYISNVMMSDDSILVSPTSDCIRQKNLPDPDDNKRLLRLEGAVACLQEFLDDARAHTRPPITESDVESYLKKTKKVLTDLKCESENKQH